VGARQDERSCGIRLIDAPDRRLQQLLAAAARELVADDTRESEVLCGALGVAGDVALAPAVENLAFAPDPRFLWVALHESAGIGFAAHEGGVPALQFAAEGSVSAQRLQVLLCLARPRALLVDGKVGGPRRARLIAEPELLDDERAIEQAFYRFGIEPESRVGRGERGSEQRGVMRLQCSRVPGRGKIAPEVRVRRSGGCQYRQCRSRFGGTSDKEAGEGGSMPGFEGRIAFGPVEDVAGHADELHVIGIELRLGIALHRTERRPRESAREPRL
jgi:hypothetical protein